MRGAARILPLLAAFSIRSGMDPGAAPHAENARAALVPDSEFVHVSPGTFRMGATTGNPEEAPVHTVTLTHGFWIQKTLVTQAEWQAVMGSNPSTHTDCPACPVDSVTYDDAQAFISQLNRRERAQRYRLPTEAEWEYAARAGTTGEFGTPGPITDGAWIADNSGGDTHPVGTRKPNAWGLYDMEGNVWEWVVDPFAPYPAGPVTDPVGIASNKYLGCRVLRGGSYASPSSYARSAYREVVYPLGRRYHTGVRLVRTQ